MKNIERFMRKQYHRETTIYVILAIKTFNKEFLYFFIGISKKITYIVLKKSNIFTSCNNIKNLPIKSWRLTKKPA